MPNTADLRSAAHLRSLAWSLPPAPTELALAIHEAVRAWSLCVADTLDPRR